MTEASRWWIAPAREARARQVARWLLSLFFLCGGVMHFAARDAFVAIVPAALPAPLLLVVVSGLCEVAFAVALFLPPLRRYAGVGLFLLILAVWPANWTMALEPARFPQFAPLVLWIRVWLQLPMLVWALVAAGLRWPFSRATARSENP